MKVGQNIKYDMIVLQNYGVQVKGKLFRHHACPLCIATRLRHNMDYLAEIYLHYQTIHIDELIGAKGKNQRTCATFRRKTYTATLAKMRTLH